MCENTNIMHANVHFGPWFSGETLTASNRRTVGRWVSRGRTEISLGHGVLRGSLEAPLSGD